MNLSHGLQLDMEELISRPTVKEYKKLKARFVIFILASNLSIFIFAFSNSDKTAEIHHPQFTVEKGHVLIQIPLQLMVEIRKDSKTKISILNDEGKLLVREAEIWPDTEMKAGQSDTWPEKQDHKYKIELSERDSSLFWNSIQKNIGEMRLVAVPPVPTSSKEIIKVKRYEELFF